MILATLSSGALPPHPLLIVPFGSTEQHGPHLPLDTDTRIAVAVSSAVARRLGSDAVVAPAIAYGDSGEHHGFAGTLSIGSEAVRMLVVELVKSAALWAPRVLLVSGHGGNALALAAAVAELRGDGHGVAWAPCGVPGGDAHAGRTETSLLLHLDPAAVDLARAEPGAAAPIAELLPSLRTGGVRAVSANGVLGDPTGASAEEGAELLARIAVRIVDALRHDRVDASGMLR